MIYSCKRYRIGRMIYHQILRYSKRFPVKSIRFLFFIFFVSSACDGPGSLDTFQDVKRASDLSDATLLDMKFNQVDGKSFPDMNSKTDIQTDTLEMPDTTEPDTSMEEKKVRVVIGENSGKLSTWLFDQESRELTELDSDESAEGITWVAAHPTQQIMYTTSGYSVRSYKLGSKGEISFLGDVMTTGQGVHVDIDKTGRWAFVASYSQNAVEVVALEDQNFVPSKVNQLLGEDGFCSKAHQIRISKNNKFAYVPCLGNDHIRVLKFDENKGTLIMTTPAMVAAGAGPRHLDFDPKKKYIYVLNEKASSISIFENKKGLVNLATVSSRPPGKPEGSASSDIHVSDDGKFLYAVNRQPSHEIGVFRITDETYLEHVEHVSGEGEHARSFALSPDGKSLLLGNTNFSNIVIYERDPSSGKLKFLKKISLNSKPMFVGFL